MCENFTHIMLDNHPQLCYNKDTGKPSAHTAFPLLSFLPSPASFSGEGLLLSFFRR